MTGVIVVYCSTCGARVPDGSRFCTKCGHALSTAIPVPAPEPKAIHKNVGIERTFKVDLNRYEPQPNDICKDVEIRVTDEEIDFFDGGTPLDRKILFKRLVLRPHTIVREGDDRGEDGKWRPVRWRTEGFTQYAPSGLVNRRADLVTLSPFWVLHPSRNADLHQEFRKNPGAYSKAPGAWWVSGYREWTWVGAPVSVHDRVVEFPVLVRVFVVEQWGGRRIPFSHPEGSAWLTLNSCDEAERLASYVNSIVLIDSSPFSPEYISTLPPRKDSASLAAYAYLFWTILVVGVLFTVLSAVGLPEWITATICLGACITVVGLLRQWHKGSKKKAGYPQGQ